MSSGSDPFPFISQAKNIPSKINNAKSGGDGSTSRWCRAGHTWQRRRWLAWAWWSQHRWGAPAIRGGVHTRPGRACKHGAPPTQTQSWHLKIFARAYHFPLQFYEDRFAKTCHFQCHLFKRKKCRSFEGVIKIWRFVSNWQDWQDQHGCCLLVFTFPSLAGVGVGVGGSTMSTMSTRMGERLRSQRWVIEVRGGSVPLCTTPTSPPPQPQMCGFC